MRVDRKEPNQPVAIGAHMARRPRIHHKRLQSRRYRNSDLLCLVKFVNILFTIDRFGNFRASVAFKVSKA